MPVWVIKWYAWCRETLYKENKDMYLTTAFMCIRELDAVSTFSSSKLI